MTFPVIILMAWVLSSHADGLDTPPLNLEFQGTVMGSDSLPIGCAVVTVSKRRNYNVATAIARSNGEFNIQCQEKGQDTLDMRVEAFGYKDTVIMVWPASNSSETFYFVLGPTIPMPDSARQYGSIDGIIRDSQGDPIRGAYVFTRPIRFGTSSDSTGNYNLRCLPVGNYQIAAGAVGYQKMVVSDVAVYPDSQTVLDFTLRVMILENPGMLRGK